MVPTVIFVNQVQCPCKLVKTENVITSSEIIFLTKFGQEVYFDITNRFISQKLKNSKEFPISPEKTKFWEISEKNS